MPQAKDPGVARKNKRIVATWGRSCLVTAAVAVAANFLQILASSGAGADDRRSLALVLAVGAVLALSAGALCVIWWKQTVELFASLRFASTVVVVLALATIAGTMVVQGESPERFEAIYGGATQTLRALHLDDLFHSFWFISLMLLMAVSLAVDAVLRIQKIVQGRTGAWANAGFVLTHLGIVVALFGGLLSMLGGQKGMLDLVEGMTSDRYKRFAMRAGEEPTGALPFAVRLDRFELDFYDPEVRIYLYELFDKVDHRGNREVKALASLEAEAGERRSFGGDFSLTVKEFRSPAGAAVEATPHSLKLTDGRQLAVRVGDTVALGGGDSVEILRFLPHFNFDIRTKQAVSASNRPENPALQVRLLRAGQKVDEGWLFALHPGFSMDGHGGALGKMLSYGYARPQVVLALARDGEPVVNDLVIDLGDSRLLPLDGHSYAVAFNEKGDRVKQYNSTITILQDGKVVLPEQPLSVNHPVWFAGWALYQANYRAWDLSYSGIQVVLDPGLGWVYAGMIIMLLGVIHILYMRRWRPWARKRAEKSAPRDEAALANGEAA